MLDLFCNSRSAYRDQTREIRFSWDVCKFVCVCLCEWVSVCDPVSKSDNNDTMAYPLWKTHPVQATFSSCSLWRKFEMFGGCVCFFSVKAYVCVCVCAFLPRFRLYALTSRYFVSFFLLYYYLIDWYISFKNIETNMVFASHRCGCCQGLNTCGSYTHQHSRWDFKAQCLHHTNTSYSHTQHQPGNHHPVSGLNEQYKQSIDTKNRRTQMFSWFVYKLSCFL